MHTTHNQNMKVLTHKNTHTRAHMHTFNHVGVYIALCVCGYMCQRRQNTNEMLQSTIKHDPQTLQTPTQNTCCCERHKPRNKTHVDDLCTRMWHHCVSCFKQMFDHTMCTHTHTTQCETQHRMTHASSCFPQNASTPKLCWMR